MTLQINQASDLEQYIRDRKFTPIGEKLFEQWEESLGDRFSETIDAIPDSSPVLDAIHDYYYGDSVAEH